MIEVHVYLTTKAEVLWHLECEAIVKLLNRLADEGKINSDWLARLRQRAGTAAEALYEAMKALQATQDLEAK